MAMELAIALGALVARTAVAQLVAGQAMDNAVWAGAASQVVDVLVSTATRQESGFQQLGQGFDVLGRKIDAVGKQVGDIPGREFEEYMAAGRRYVRDLPDTWRSARDRRGLIQDARREFVHAYGIAEHMRSPHRQALADVAIAGCWLWVPSLPDVRKTIGAARQILETELLRGSTLPTKSYADVLYLCRSYGEQPRTAGKPVLHAPGQAPTPLARLAVRAPYGSWVACAGIEVRIDAVRAGDSRHGPGKARPCGSAKGARPGTEQPGGMDRAPHELPRRPRQPAHHGEHPPGHEPRQARNHGDPRPTASPPR
ncbi:hypothetical protein [Streptomyces sp. NRRL F-525]|uniref:hypothetical protein n=1 Tax=Streptomyces sp. NRRL F-525 TaxID=1463861 RepID=UPI00052765B4|nr:hypothetical protein [Streptomyces sp. NRRL F-525]